MLIGAHNPIFLYVLRNPIMHVVCRTANASVAETTMVRKRCCELATIACARLPPSTKIDSPTEGARTKLIEGIRKLVRIYLFSLSFFLALCPPLWLCRASATRRYPHGARVVDLNTLSTTERFRSFVFF